MRPKHPTSPPATAANSTNPSGIGLETTVLFLREGASVLMTDISAKALTRALAIAKEKAPHAVGKLETKPCDVTKESDMQGCVEYLDAWGGLDIIFNNAGIMHADDAGQSIHIHHHVYTPSS